MQDKRTKEDLRSELLIANHNMVSVLKREQEAGRTDELEELFHMFESHYDEVLKEIYRRMEFYEHSQRK